MAWSTENIPDLSGKNAVVTGANGGLGLATAKALAGAGAAVVVAARDQEKAQAAIGEIEKFAPGASVEVVEIDLASLSSVEKASRAIKAGYAKVDVLVNNAGLMAMPERETEDGFEMQFGVNHLGHWALTCHLLGDILASDAGRVVNVTSTAHHFGRAVQVDNPHLEGEYDPWKAYAQSKLANYHFTLGLQREFKDHGATAISVMAHPGLTNSDLQKRTTREGGASSFWERMADRFGMSNEDGALPQLRAATDPSVKGGEMYAPRFINKGAPVKRPVMRRIGLDEAIASLWRVSEQETGLKLDFEAAAAPR